MTALGRLLEGRSASDINLGTQKYKLLLSLEPSQLATLKVVDDVCSTIDCDPFTSKEMRRLMDLVFQQQNWNAQQAVNVIGLIIASIGCAVAAAGLGLGFWNTVKLRKQAKLLDGAA